MPSGSGRLERAALLAVAASLLLVATHQLVALDLWWQLAAGRWIEANGLPQTDPFSFGFPGLPWVEHRWLFFLAEHALAASWGLNSLIFAKLVWLALCLALLNAAMRPAPGWARALGLLTAVVLMHSRLKVRPELASYLCVIAFLWVYESHRRHGRGARLALLPLVQLFWSNTHTLWIVGPALAWTAWLLEAGLARWPSASAWGRLQPASPPVRRRALLVVALAVSVASLATPYVALGQLYPTTILEQIGVGSKLREVIVELRSPFTLAGDPVFFGTYLAGVAASFAAMLLPVRVPLFRVVVWAGFVGFTFLAARNVALLGPVAGWVIAQQLGDWWAGGADVRWPRLPRRAAGFVLVSAAVLGGAAATDSLWRPRGWDQRFGTGLRPGVYPVEAMAFVAQHGLPRPVMSGLADASYLIYEGGPGSVFIDGRLEVYGADRVIENTEQWSDGGGAMADADRLGIDTVLLPFPLMANAVSRFDASEHWRAVYYDSARVLFVRQTPQNAARTASLTLDWNATPRPVAEVPRALRPRDWAGGWPLRAVDASEPLGRAALLLHVGAPDAAEAALEEVVRLEPDQPDARLLLGLLADLAGDPAAAQVHFTHLDPAWLAEPRTAAVHFELSRHRGGAERRFDLALRALDAGVAEPRVLAELVRGATDSERAARVKAALARAEVGADPAVARQLRSAGAALGRSGAAGVQ